MFFKLGAKHFLRSAGLTERKQRTSEHFASRQVPVGWFGVIGCIFSRDSFSQLLERRCLIATRESNLSFKRKVCHLQHVRSRVGEEPHLRRKSLLNRTQCSEFSFSIRRLFRSGVRT